MLSKCLNRLVSIALVVTLSAGSVNAFVMTCYGNKEPAPHTIACHDMEAKHEQEKETCCINTFCANCFIQLASLGNNLPAHNALVSGLLFGHYSDHLKGGFPEGLERPPKILV